MSESMGKETKQNSSKSDKKNINHTDNSIESQTDGPGSILEIKDLCFAYPEEEKRALNHISFQIKEGEFLVLCGKSGCGKSTLLKHMKTPLTPHGKRKGEILFDGKNLHEMTGREQSQRIGYVLQNPDNQIVTDKVWHELAFGLESLGYKSAEIRIRVAEMASYFGIQDWFYKNVAELSGGQKQLLNLASIMAMHPDILILDEPTSQLDPIAASDFLGTVKKINRDLGTTILLTEHRLEEVFPAADRVVVMEGGEVLCMGTPEEIGEELKKQNHEMFLAMPVPMQIYAKVKEASSASTVSNDTDDLGVYVNSAEDEDLTRNDVKNLKIDYTDSMTQKTKKVSLSKIADFSTADSPKSIYRKGQTRYIAVKADIKDGYVVSDVSREVEKIVNQTKKPAGYEMELDGENEATTEAMGQVLLMMALGVLLMYLIMVAQFQSLLSPFIILFTIPLAFTGGFLGLWISGSDVSVIAMIGFVMLSGIIVNNGIVLVDYINQLRRSGVEKRQAIEEAGVTRLRPILMTALTTVLGLIPMVAGSSMGTDMTRPMAIVTIGGLVYGTLLTLFVVPCIYDLLNRKKDMGEKTVDEESMIEEAMDEKE